MRNFLYFICALFAAKVIVLLAIWASMGLSATINGWAVPQWIFWVGIVVDAYISWRAYMLSRQL